MKIVKVEVPQLADGPRLRVLATSGRSRPIRRRKWLHAVKQSWERYRTVVKQTGCTAED